MSSVVISGDTSGSITLSAPAQAGSNTVTLPAATGSIPLLTIRTSQPATGASVEFPNIPSWAKRITVMFNGVSTLGSTPFLIQLGDSDGIETTGYFSSSVLSTTASVSVGTSRVDGFYIHLTSSAQLLSGAMTLNLINAVNNIWVSNGTYSLGTISVGSVTSGGNKSLSGVLDRIKLTTTTGTDTFDAGTINIMYEG